MIRQSQIEFDLKIECCWFFFLVEIQFGCMGMGDREYEMWLVLIFGMETKTVNKNEKKN